MNFKMKPTHLIGLFLLCLLLSLPDMSLTKRHAQNSINNLIIKREQMISLNQVHHHHSTNFNHHNNNTTSIPWRSINFISPSQSLSQSQWWHEAPSFSARGMEHLYMLNEIILNWIQPPGLPAGIITEQLLDDPKTVLNENRGKLLSHFWGLLLTSTICFCIAVIIPLTGFLICCCLCNTGKKKSHSTSSHSSSSRQTRAKYYGDPYNSGSGLSSNRRKSRRKYKVDRTCDPCCRSFFGINLFIVLLLISFFIICAFVTNEYLRVGINDLPKTVNKSLDDMILYLNNTQHEVNVLLRINYHQLEQELSNSLDRSGLIVKNRLALVSHASALENLTEIVTKLDSVQTDLKSLSGQAVELSISLTQLHDKLNRSKKELEQFFMQCKDPVCNDLKKRYQRVLNSFSISNRVDELPDLSPLMNNITELLNHNIVHEVRKGKEEFDNLSKKIQSTVSSTIPAIKEQIKLVGQELSLAADEINEALRKPYNDLYTAKRHTNTGYSYVKKYEKYRWYACLGGAGIVLGLFLFYSFGLMSGCCNDQPTRHNYKRRSKSASRFLKCGIVLTFLLIGPVLLCTIVLFLLGGISDKVLCHYLENPSKSQTRQIVAILQKRFEQNNIVDSINVIQGIKPNAADVLLRCHQNMSLYNVLQLNRYNDIKLKNRVIQGFNITKILTFKERYQIEEKLNAFLDQVSVNPGHVVLLTSQGHKLLESLKDTSLGTLNFSSYAEVVKHSITPLDLNAIANELDQEANRLPKSDVSNMARLKNIALDLRQLIQLVNKIKDTIVKLNQGAEKIENKTHYGNKTLKEALTDLLNQAKLAQKFIEERGYQEIKNVAHSFTDDMSSLIDQYAHHVIDEVEHGIGKCEPASRAINASVTALCKEIVLPLNGYWFSLSFGLFLLIPSMIFAYILSGLYQRVKRSRTRRESDSTLDNLNDDDIPLAHVDSKNNLNASYESRAAIYGDHSSGSAPSAPAPSPRDDNWSPGAPPPHLYISRPPPYNFAN